MNTADLEHQAQLEQQRRILNRLRRAQGQLAAVIVAVEQGKPCREVITQIAAVSKAVDRAGVAVISNSMQACLSDPSSATDDAKEFEKLFMMLA